MDSPNRTTRDCLTLGQLVADALHQLEEDGYSKKSLWRYRTVWGRLIDFANESGLEDAYSERLAGTFVDTWHLRQERMLPGQGWRQHVAHCVKVLGDFYRYGDLERSRMIVERLDIPEAMKKPLRDYQQYCRDRRHLRPLTVSERIRAISMFLHFAGARDVQRLQDLQPADLTAFVVSRQQWRPKTVSQNVSSVRLFLQFLNMRGILPHDLSHVLPTIRVTQDATIPSVWDPELVPKLLDVVDRSSPRGKRDYVILLLAARLGLRVTDIRTLRLDEINWGAATIDLTQSKTDAALRLPLSEEVGEALIDYLRFARPKVEHREVILTLRPPFAPFAENSHLHNIVTHWRNAAGIEFRSQQRHGLHSLRHTLATQLLRADTPFHVISEILGHATKESTLIYAKADTEALRGAALDTEEAHHVE